MNVIKLIFFYIIILTEKIITYMEMFKIKTKNIIISWILNVERGLFKLNDRNELNGIDLK